MSDERLIFERGHLILTRFKPNVRNKNGGSGHGLFFHGGLEPWSM